MRFNSDSFQMEWTYHVVLYLVTHTLNPWLKMHDQRDGKLNEIKQVYRHSHQRACISAACAENFLFFFANAACAARQVGVCRMSAPECEKVWLWQFSLQITVDRLGGGGGDTSRQRGEFKGPFKVETELPDKIFVWFGFVMKQIPL